MSTISSTARRSSNMELPASVAQCRSDLYEFRSNMSDCYRRLIARRIEEQLAAHTLTARPCIKKLIYDAASDLAHLARQTVHASVVIKASSQTRSQDLAKAKRAVIEKLLPTFKSSRVPYDLVLPKPVTLAELRAHRGYSEAREAAVRSLVDDATQLVECGLLGRRIYDRTAAANHGAYSYILRHVTESLEVSSTPWKETGYDPKAPLGSRRTMQRAKKRHAWERNLTEQHVHHLENISLSPFATYTKSLPSWAQPLRKIVPTWVKPDVQVIEGKIVREEVSILDNYTREWESTVVEQEKLSPAIVLGDLVLAGWSDQDLQGGISPWMVWGGIAILGLLGAALFIPGAGPIVARAGVSAMKIAGRAAVIT